MKNTSTINSASTENMKCSIIEACLIYQFKSGFVAWSWCIAKLLFISRSLNMFQAKNNVRSAPASSALTLASHQSHNACTANRHLHGSGERMGVQRRTKVSFSRTMMQALELLQLVKRYVFRQSDVEQWRNQACSYSLLSYTCPKASVSQSVRLSIGQSVKIMLNKKFL